MKRSKPASLSFLCLVLLLLVKPAHAQLVFGGQIRTRTELRDGYASLNPEGSQAALFTSQRTRLTFAYRAPRVQFHVAIQDVRVWGQDASTISNTDGAKLALHEAWTELVLLNHRDTSFRKDFLENLSLKIGRQEIVYDDSRLIGNLDWQQQARRHDALLVKGLHKGWQYDLGFAFNQNGENNMGTAYLPGNLQPYVLNAAGTLVVTPAGMVPLTIGGSPAGYSSKSGSPYLSNPAGTNGLNQDYKFFQYLYVSRKFAATKFSALFFKDDFGKYRLDSAGTAATGYVYGRRYDLRGTNSRYTYGLMVNGAAGKQISWQLGAYLQSGRDRDGKSLSAQHLTASLLFRKGKFSTGPGYDYLSGDAAATPATETHRFDPLYGTPHKFWGYMDYFYAASGSPAGGLSNLYLKNKLTWSKGSLGLDIHHFSLAKQMLAAGTDKELGWEFDLTGQYAISKIASIEAGYCVMKAAAAMEPAKGKTPGTSHMTPQWAYVSLNITPDFLFTGITSSK